MNPNLLLTGVYSITHVKSGRAYVGSATQSFKSRWSLHRSQLSKGRHHNRHLQNAWNKYGSKAFRFEVIKVCPPDKCLALEQRLIQKLRTYQLYGYNVCRIVGSRLGVKSSEETKLKIKKAANTEHRRKAVSELWKGRVITEAHREAIRRANRSRVVSDVIRQKISNAKKGVPWSEARREAQRRKRAT